MKTEAANRYRIYTRIRLVAKILSVISILLLILFLTDNFDPYKIENREIIGLAFFPFGVVAGFIIAWKWETLGALISLTSLLCFYLIYGVFLSGSIPGGFSFLAFTSPALIFLITGIYGRIAIRDYLSEPKQETRAETGDAADL